MSSKYRFSTARDTFVNVYQPQVDAIIAEAVADHARNPGIHNHPAAIMLLCAMRIIGHTAGYLDQERRLKGEPMWGYDASTEEVYRLINAGRPMQN